VSGALIAPVVLIETVEETAIRRSSDSQTDSFTIDITSLTLSGVLMLSPASPP
jgi:hypothetical protein